MITQFSTGRLHKRRTILKRLFSDVGLSTVVDDMRVQGQPRYKKSTKTCALRPSDPADTDVDRWNRSDCNNGDKDMLLDTTRLTAFSMMSIEIGVHTILLSSCSFFF